MSKSKFLVAMLVAACTACSSKQPVQTTAAAVPCTTDSKYAQVKITIEHDIANAPTKIREIAPVTIYSSPDPTKPDHKGKVCWVIEPLDSAGNPTQLWASLFLTSKDGTAAFEKWTKKQKMPGDPRYIASGIPSVKEILDPGWGYSLDYGTLSVDPVIIIIDDGK